VRRRGAVNRLALITRGAVLTRLVTLLLGLANITITIPSIRAARAVASVTAITVVVTVAVTTIVLAWGVVAGATARARRPTARGATTTTAVTILTSTALKAP
jgi:heme/copper-type cytochrome/quinol oxidase subunit 2